jgi:uncharacterized protein YjdB
MRHLRPGLLPTVLPALVLFSLSCEEVDVTAVDAASVVLQPELQTFSVGELRQFTARVEDAAGHELRGRTTAWSVSNPTVAEVDDQGRVTGLAPGEARVRAQVEGVAGEATVVITPKPVETVEVQPATATIAHDGAVQLEVTLRAADGSVITGRPIAFASENTAVATVDPTGLVRAAGEGTARITATAEGKVGAASVIVGPAPVARVDVAPASSSILVGEVVSLSATTRAADGGVLTGRAVAWRTSDAAVATVDAAGNVTGTGAGGATITATSEGVDGTAAVTVTVQPVARVTVSPAASSLLVGQTATLTATLEAADGTPLGGRAVAWSSADPGVATVAAGNGATATVTAVGAGSTTITAVSEGVSGTATVGVAEPVASVTVTPPSANLAPGGTQTFQAELRSASGTVITGRNIVWTSSDPNVFALSATSGASVGGNAGAAGSATITATSEGVSGSATVGVAEPVASVTVTPPNASLAPGGTQTFQAELRSASGAVITGRTIAWTSSDPNVFALAATSGASVSGTAGTSGSATVTATSEGVSGGAGVTVTLNVGSVTIAPNPPPDLLPGQRADLTATVRAANGTVLTDRPVTWTVDPAALSIGTSGSMNDRARITALAPTCTGESCTTTVTAAADGTNAQVQVRVLKAVATIAVSPQAPMVSAGGTVALTATLRAADGTVLTGRALTWSSLTPALATVDPATGVVTAASDPSCAAGSETCAATIRATAPNDAGTGSDDVRQDVSVHVRKRVATVTVTPPSSSIAEGGAQQLTATVRAADGTVLTQRPTSWSAAPQGVVTLTPATGATTTATGVAAGTATVTATAEGVSGNAQVTVVPRVASVTVVPNAVTLAPGAPQTFTAELRDTSGGLLTGRPVSWSSSDQAVFNLSSSAGPSVAGVAGSDGTATVTATAEGVSGTATVTVLTPVATVTVVPQTADLAPGDVQTFTAELRAANGTQLTGRTVTWHTTDANVFALSATAGESVGGAAVGTGSATVVATSEGRVGTATVSVSAVVHSVTIVPNAVTLTPNAAQSFTAELRDINGNLVTGQAIDWDSNNTSVFALSTTSGPTVSGTALGVGVATITATAAGVSGTASVTVTPVPAPPPVPEPVLGVANAVVDGAPAPPSRGRPVRPIAGRSGAGGPAR